MSSNLASLVGGILLVVLGATNPVGWTLMGLAAAVNIVSIFFFIDSETYERIFKGNF